MTSYTVELEEEHATLEAIRSFGISEIHRREERGVVVLEWDPATRNVTVREPAPPPGPKTYTKRCANARCGKPFTARKSNAKTCSDPCRMRLATERRKELYRIRKAAA